MAFRTSILRLCCSLGFLLVVESRVTAEGGLSFLHPLQACDANVVRACETAPADGKEHVYTFIVNGCDPLNLGNLNAMADYLRGLGFRQTFFEPCWGHRGAGRQIREIRLSDPDAKIVLVGYSWAAVVVRRLANDLEKEGITLDRLVYLGGDYIRNTQQSRPANVAKVVNIRGHGLMLSGYDLFFNGADIDNATNLQLDTRHFVLPSRAETVETLASMLVTLAQESHELIAARKVKESPAVGQPTNRPVEKTPPVGHPASDSSPGAASVSMF
jgi:hypothetical protein